MKRSKEQKSTDRKQMTGLQKALACSSLLLLTGAMVLTGCGSQTAQQEVVHNTDEITVAPAASTAWLPAGVTQQAGEAVANPALEQVIVDFYGIPEEALADSWYQYNRVDLNQDGKEEFFVLVGGWYTSGTGGMSALWLDESYQVLQDFTLVNNPVLVEEAMEQGHHNLLVQRGGGGADSAVVRLTYDGNQYSTVNDGQVVENLEDITGTAFLCEPMDYVYLGEQN